MIERKQLHLFECLIQTQINMHSVSLLFTGEGPENAESVMRLMTFCAGESPEDVGGVKAMVKKQLAGFSKMQSPKANPVRPLPQRCTYPRADTKKRGRTPHPFSVKQEKSLKISFF